MSRPVLKVDVDLRAFRAALADYAAYRRKTMAEVTEKKVGDIFLRAVKHEKKAPRKALPKLPSAKSKKSPSWRLVQYIYDKNKGRTPGGKLEVAKKIWAQRKKHSKGFVAFILIAAGNAAKGKTAAKMMRGVKGRVYGEARGDKIDKTIEGYYRYSRPTTTAGKPVRGDGAKKRAMKAVRAAVPEVIRDTREWLVKKLNEDAKRAGLK